MNGMEIPTPRIYGIEIFIPWKRRRNLQAFFTSKKALKKTSPECRGNRQVTHKSRQKNHTNRQKRCKKYLKQFAKTVRQVISKMSTEFI